VSTYSLIIGPFFTTSEPKAHPISWRPKQIPNSGTLVPRIASISAAYLSRMRCSDSMSGDPLRTTPSCSLNPDSDDSVGLAVITSAPLEARDSLSLSNLSSEG
jgi:hypothetical protein